MRIFYQAHEIKPLPAAANQVSTELRDCCRLELRVASANRDKGARFEFPHAAYSLP
jgi:hypothetical protein